MSFTKNIETIKYNYGNQSSIFEVGHDYGVVTKISDFWQQNNTLYFETTLSDLHKATISLELFTNNTLRMKYFRYNEKNRYEEHLNKLKLIKPDFIENDKSYNIKYKNYKIIISKSNFNIEIYDDKNLKILSLYKRPGYHFFENYLAPPLGWKRIKNHVGYPFISFDLENNENLYGIGEKYKALNKRGIKSEVLSQSTNIVNTTDISYNSIPLIYSTRGYGILVNSGVKSHWEVGSYSTDAFSIMTEEQCLDMFIFLDPTIKGLIKRYTELTGTISSLPDKAYGVIISRLYYKNEKEALDEIKNAHKQKFPLDIIGIDPKWIKKRYTKTCNFSFNDQAFGDLKVFVKKVKKLGVETSLWINTNVQVDDSNYFKESWNKGYLVKDKQGKPLAVEIGPGLTQKYAYVLDFTNPKAYQFYKDNLKKLLDQGVRFLTPDYGGGTARNALMHNKRSGREMKNFQQYIYPKIVFEVMEENLGKGNAILYRRCGYIGTHKFAGKWGGDSFARFQELKNQIRAGLSLGICSEFMWGIDLGGGYRGNLYEELTIRWNQAGALLPYTRFHGIGKREPWYISKKATQNAKKYLMIKRKLLPYYKHYENIAKNSGLPMLRALVIDYQNDILARTIEDQYLLGKDIMVAPVIDKGANERQVYFPIGDDWIDYENNKVYKGGKNYIIEAKLEKIPIFIKDGAVIPIFNNIKFNTDLDKLQNQKISLIGFGQKNCDGQYEFEINGQKKVINFQKKGNNIKII